MKEIDKHKVDELFRRNLGDPDIPFEEGDWLDMQGRLAKKTRQRYFLIGISTGAAAAVVLLLSFWWVLQPAALPQGKPGLVKSAPGNSKPGREGLAGGPGHINGAVSDQQGSPASVIPKTPVTGDVERNPAAASRDQQRAYRVTAVPGGAATPPKTGSQGLSSAASQDNNDPLSLAGSVNPPDPGSPATGNLAASNPGTNNTPLAAIVQTGIAAVDSSLASTPADDRPTGKKPAAFKRSLVLSFSAGTDYSAVNSLRGARSGSSFGLGVAYDLNRRVGVSVGAILAHKVYSADASLYHPDVPIKYAYNMSEIDGTCRVLDIPLNVRYAFISGKKSRVLFSGGVSSYWMLREDYQYNFSSAYPKPPQRYSISNENRHLFSIANVGLIYQRQLGPLASISVQPYVKTPLKNIGYGNVKLYTGGADLSLNMNLSRLRQSLKKAEKR